LARPWNVLFVCTGNCCRSQMAEALLRHLGGDRFNALSAGSHPAGYVHPLTVETMRQMGISTEGQYSKSVFELANTPMDVVLTLCDDAAGQPCPNWPGPAVKAHWGLPDPAFASGTEQERLAFATRVANQLRGWIEQLVRLPIDSLTPEQLKTELDRITRS
jgi:protein-tyrosine-phosphatase